MRTSFEMAFMICGLVFSCFNGSKAQIESIESFMASIAFFAWKIADNTTKKP